MTPKQILITGSTSGIGRETALALAKEGHHLILLARNTGKAQQLKQEIASLNPTSNVNIIACDLADLKQVGFAAEQILLNHPQLDVLLNNAGGIIPNKQKSKDGFELTFAMNHLGHFLLTFKLLSLLKINNARIINVSSMAHQAGKLNFDDLLFENNSYSAIQAYANAKLCNIYFTRELHRRYHAEGITAYALHPGVVRTNFAADYKGFVGQLFSFIRPLMINAQKGAETSIYLCSEEGIESFSGSYFVKKRVKKTSRIATDPVVAQKLWDVSMKMIQEMM